LRREVVMNLRAESWSGVERLVAERVGVKRERAVVAPEVRRLDSLSVVVGAGTGFLFELFDVDDEVVDVDFVLAVPLSIGSIELSTSALARFIMRKSDFVVSLSKEWPKRDVTVVLTL